MCMYGPIRIYSYGISNAYGIAFCPIIYQHALKFIALWTNDETVQVVTHVLTICEECEITFGISADILSRQRIKLIAWTVYILSKHAKDN